MLLDGLQKYSVVEIYESKGVDGLNWSVLIQVSILASLTSCARWQQKWNSQPRWSVSTWALSWRYFGSIKIGLRLVVCVPWDLTSNVMSKDLWPSFWDNPELWWHWQLRTRRRFDDCVYQHNNREFSVWAVALWLRVSISNLVLWLCHALFFQNSMNNPLNCQLENTRPGCPGSENWSKPH